jgi:hypothetical protein
MKIVAILSAGFCGLRLAKKARDHRHSARAPNDSARPSRGEGDSRERLADPLWRGGLVADADGCAGRPPLHGAVQCGVRPIGAQPVACGRAGQTWGYEPDDMNLTTRIRRH